MAYLSPAAPKPVSALSLIKSGADEHETEAEEADI